MQPHLFEFIKHDTFKHDTFTRLPKIGWLTIMLIESGGAKLEVNGNTAVCHSPCILLSSWLDKIKWVKKNAFSAKSLRFQPKLINKNIVFVEKNNVDKHDDVHLCDTDIDDIAETHDRGLLDPFFTRNDKYQGVIKPLPQTHHRISEWFEQLDIFNCATIVKSFGKKTQEHNLTGGVEQIDCENKSVYIEKLCHIRRYLLLILLTIEETYENRNEHNFDTYTDESVITTVLEYIHANYHKPITLGALCKLANMNRTSLANKFKERTRQSPIDYLLHHRLIIACDYLTHSKLSISKIAETTGFKYESYFSRQFSAKIGTTPSAYRQSDGFETLNNRESNIVEEF